jgi:hypothetical protein
MNRFKAPSFSWSAINVGKSYSDKNSKNNSRVTNTISGNVTCTIPGISGNSNVNCQIRLVH